MLPQSGLDFSNPDTAKQLAAFQAAIPDHSKQADANVKNSKDAVKQQKIKQKEQQKQQEAKLAEAEAMARQYQERNAQRAAAFLGPAPLQQYQENLFQPNKAVMGNNQYYGTTPRYSVIPFVP